MLRYLRCTTSGKISDDTRTDSSGNVGDLIYCLFLTNFYPAQRSMELSVKMRRDHM